MTNQSMSVCLIWWVSLENLKRKSPYADSNNLSNDERHWQKQAFQKTLKFYVIINSIRFVALLSDWKTSTL